MNAELMITIAFCLIVLLGSLALGVLFAQSVRGDKAKEAEAKRLAAGGEIRQPRSRRAADESDARAAPGRGSRPGRRGEKPSRGACSGEDRREVKGPDDQGCWPRPPEFIEPRQVPENARVQRPWMMNDSAVSTSHLLGLGRAGKTRRNEVAAGWRRT